jgi:hypothetical protein
MHRCQIRSFMRSGRTKLIAHHGGHRLPDRTLADIFDVPEHVVEHPVSLHAKTAPICWVEGFFQLRRKVRSQIPGLLIDFLQRLLSLHRAPKPQLR